MSKHGKPQTADDEFLNEKTNNELPKAEMDKEVPPNSTPVERRAPSGIKIAEPVHFFFQEPKEAWAAIVVRLCGDEKVDLIVFRPDGATQRYYGIPRRNRRQLAGCWDLVE